MYHPINYADPVPSLQEMYTQICFVMSKQTLNLSLHMLRVCKIMVVLFLFQPVDDNMLKGDGDKHKPKVMLAFSDTDCVHVLVMNKNCSKLVSR